MIPRYRDTSKPAIVRVRASPKGLNLGSAEPLHHAAERTGGRGRSRGRDRARLRSRVDGGDGRLAGCRGPILAPPAAGPRAAAPAPPGGARPLRPPRPGHVARGPAPVPPPCPAPRAPPP